MGVERKLAGRPRRIGWLDIPALRYAYEINGVTHMNITKLDVLDKLEEIKIGVAYSIDGQVGCSQEPKDPFLRPPS